MLRGKKRPDRSRVSLQSSYNKNQFFRDISHYRGIDRRREIPATEPRRFFCIFINENSRGVVKLQLHILLKGVAIIAPIVKSIEKGIDRTLLECSLSIKAGFRRENTYAVLPVPVMNGR